jgi:hypothetical protein
MDHLGGICFINLDNLRAFCGLGGIQVVPGSFIMDAKIIL